MRTSRLFGLLFGALCLATSGCVQTQTPAQAPPRVVVEPAMFAGFVQVRNVDGALQVILSTATQDVVAQGPLVDELAEFAGRQVRVHGRWIDTGPVPVLEVERIEPPLGP